MAMCRVPVKKVKILFFLILPLLFASSDAPPPCWLLRKEQAPFAQGHVKQVAYHRLKNSSEVVILATARANVSERVARLYFASEAAALARYAAPGGVVPRLLNACGARGNILEAFRPFISVCVDARVRLWQRLRVAVSALRLVDFFRAERVIYGDMGARQFGVSTDYRVALLDLQTFRRYNASRRLGDDVPCGADDAFCHEHFFNRGASDGRKLRNHTCCHVLRALRLPAPPPLDFACDAARGRCRGLDHRTMLHAVCRLMLQHLFHAQFIASPQQRALVGIRRVLDDGCLSRDPARRRSTRAIAAQLQRFADAEESSLTFEPLPLAVNEASAREYWRYSDKFKAVL